MAEITMTPIGTVRSTRAATHDDRWDSETSSIELDPEQFNAEALDGLEAFSHVEVIYLGRSFHVEAFRSHVER